MTTTVDLLPWQAAILDQLEEIAATEILDDAAIATRPFLIIGFKPDETATLLDRCRDVDEAENELEQRHGNPDFEHVRIVELAAIGFDVPVVDDYTDPGDTTDADGGLFDASQYEREDLAIPKVDGNQVDKIRISFSGSVMLDRSDPADVALFNRLRLKQELELRVAGTVSKIQTGYTTGKDGELDAIVAGKTLNVGTVWVLDPETLS